MTTFSEIKEQDYFFLNGVVYLKQEDNTAIRMDTVRLVKFQPEQKVEAA